MPGRKRRAPQPRVARPARHAAHDGSVFDRRGCRYDRGVRTKPSRYQPHGRLSTLERDAHFCARRNACSPRSTKRIAFGFRSRECRKSFAMRSLPTKTTTFTTITEWISAASYAPHSPTSRIKSFKAPRRSRSNSRGGSFSTTRCRYRVRFRRRCLPLRSSATTPRTRSSSGTSTSFISGRARTASMLQPTPTSGAGSIS